jgi:hypothetical protein
MRFHKIRRPFRAVFERTFSGRTRAETTGTGSEMSGLTPQSTPKRPVLTAARPVRTGRFWMPALLSAAIFRADDDCTIAFTRLNIGVCVWWNESVGAFVTVPFASSWAICSADDD